MTIDIKQMPEWASHGEVDEELMRQAEAEKPGTEIAGDFDKRGTKMTERDSYERVIEGLKIASDGCRNLATYFGREQWDMQADVLDMTRKQLVRLAGIGVTGDDAPSHRKLYGSALTRMEAYDRVYAGLTQAAGGMLQIAGGQRGDLRWSKVAFMAYSLRDTAGKLIRMKKTILYQPN